MFKIGEVVTVKVKNVLWEARHRYARNVHIPEYTVYTGTVSSPLRGHAATHLSLSTGNPAFPFRHIDLDRIVGQEAAPKPIVSKVSHWSVVGSKGSKYDITLDGSDFHCTCTGFGFRHRCKHIDELKWKLKEAA